MYITRARHVGYDPPTSVSGAPRLTPLVRELRSLTCLTQTPEFVGGRHIDWGTATGLPVAAVAWYCCSFSTCTDAEVEAGDCYKLPVCWPLGAGPGITKRLALYAIDSSDCWSAQGKRIILEFNGTDWVGSMDLRGGTLDFTFSCNPAMPPDSPAKFTLAWTGCDTGSVVAGNYCVEPLLVQFPSIGLPFGNCCDCRTSGAPPTTNAPVQVDFVVAGNCHKTTWARHVGYQSDGTPIVASELACDWDPHVCYQCVNMRCPLVATISGCVTWNGTYDVNYASDKWIISGIPAINTITCTDLGSCGNVRLTLSIQCGFGGGQASVDIPAEDLEDLDVTINITLTNPDGNPTCCSGTIQVNLMR